MPRSSRDPDPAPRRKPSTSGADTPRSSDVVSIGGKLDPSALRKRIEQSTSPSPDQPDDLLTAPDSPDEPDAHADDDAPNRVVFVLQRDLDKRLDKYLGDRIPFMSRTQLQRLIDEGGVTVNARPAKSSTKLRINDRVEVFVPPPPPTEAQPEDIPLNVLYEDEHIIVLNKQPDIIVHPARNHNSGTMINALAFHFANRSSGALSTVGKEFARPGVVHRLDRHTSGLIVFAKNDEAHWRLGQQFERRTVDKRYLALVHGLFEPPVDVIDLPLGPHPSREKGYREKYVVRHDTLGKPALTIARVRESFRSTLQQTEPTAPPAPEPSSTLGWSPAASRAAKPEVPPHRRGYSSPAEPARGFALVELELKTGRTHQIRVHLSHRGYPIVGDDMYDGRALTFADLGLTDSPGSGQHSTDPIISRQALHATTLAFRHPVDNRQMHFEAPLPLDMQRALAVLRRVDPLAVWMTPPGATIAQPTGA